MTEPDVPRRAIFDAEEEVAHGHLMAFMTQINMWGMTANAIEMVAAIHVLQGILIQHMLHRLEPEQWSSWGQPDVSEGPR